MNFVNLLARKSLLLSASEIRFNTPLIPPRLFAERGLGVRSTHLTQPSNLAANPNMIHTPTDSPLPRTRGRGVGGEGNFPPHKSNTHPALIASHLAALEHLSPRLCWRQAPNPHPKPLAKPASEEPGLVHSEMLRPQFCWLK